MHQLRTLFPGRLSVALLAGTLEIILSNLPLDRQYLVINNEKFLDFITVQNKRQRSTSKRKLEGMNQRCSVYGTAVVKVQTACCF